MPTKRPARRGRKSAYHHGDLRQALLAAGEAELAVNGIEGFTLRGCAKRAGVSHAAPAHHFKDANALLTALATLGFTRFAQAMRAHQAKASAEPRAQLVAAGLGYLDFALAYPALFRLMFGSRRPDFADPSLHAVAEESFAILVGAIARVRGRDPWGDPRAMEDVAASWALVHGIAMLTLAGSVAFQAALPKERWERAVDAIIGRLVPPDAPRA